MVDSLVAALQYAQPIRQRIRHDIPPPNLTAPPTLILILQPGRKPLLGHPHISLARLLPSGQISQLHVDHLDVAVAAAIAASLDAHEQVQCAGERDARAKGGGEAEGETAWKGRLDGEGVDEREAGRADEEEQEDAGEDAEGECADDEIRRRLVCGGGGVVWW